MCRLTRLATIVCVVFLSAACGSDPEQQKLEYVASGDAYVAQRQYAEAILQYRNAVALDASFGEARFKLAKAYEVNRDLPAALREYVRAADLMPENAEAQLQAGKMLVAAGQFADARARAAAVVANDPKNVNALIVLGNALAGLKELDSAIGVIEQAIATEPSLEFSYANLGVLQLEKGDLVAAEGALKRAVAVDPKSATARLNLANFYWARNDRAAALRELEAALAIDPKSPVVNRALAAFYVTNGERARSEPYLRAFAESAGNVDAKFLLADYYLADGKTADAVAVLQPLVSTSDGYGPATLRLAVIDFRSGRREDAYRKLDEVLKRFPKSVQALESRAAFLVSERRFEEALKTADAVLADGAPSLRSHYIRGLALRSLGRRDEAIQAMQKALEISPAFTSAQLQLAEMYLEQRNGRAALDLLGRIVKVQPRSVLAHLLLGQALLQSGNLPSAEAEFLLVARANPSSAVIQTWLGRLYGAKGETTKAAQAFNRALELEPSSVLAFNGLVSLDVVEGRLDAARKRLESRVTDQTTDTALLFLAGNTYLALGDYGRAEALFQKILTIDSTHADAYGKLGTLYWAQGRLQEASAKYSEAARLQTKPVAATTLLGMLSQLQNKPAEARKQYEQALQLDPRAAVAANNLAAMLADNGENLDMALQLAQTAKAQLPQNAQASDTLGWVYYKKGLGTLAITALQEGVKQDPANPVIHYHLGLAFLQNGEKPQARASLERALRLKPEFRGADDAKRVLGTLKG